MANSDLYSVDKLTAEARRLAADYRRATGKALPLSGEIAVNDAMRLLKLEEPTQGQGGYDAIRRSPSGPRRVQIKGRVVFDETKHAPRIGQLKIDQSWDEIILVLMDEDYEPSEIYCADRTAIETALGSKPANKRGAMTVAQFKIIGKLVWSAASDPRSATG